MTDLAGGELVITRKTLDEWQEYMAAHFTNLSEQRKSKNVPVFALEHGLIKTELEDIFIKLKYELAKQGTNRSHWLLWVIYATELGYEYDGEEYWQSFEEQTPFWDSSQREFLRDSFRRFQQKYSGVVPSGVWANHFSIISLPITHAILPRDLQYHFAHLLYRARYKITSISYADAASIGRVLANDGFYINSSRFQSFLEQEELVGRIALAMLDDGINSSQSNLIYAPTLGRIISDLEGKRNAREWIQIARRDMKARVLGAGSISHFMPINGQLFGVSSNVKQQCFLKPRLSLQRIDFKKWIAVVEVPNFSDAIDNPDLLNFLRKTRFSVSGVKGTWLPGEVLLHGILKRKLSDWPSELEPIISFEKENGALTHLVESECRITSGSSWLFRISPDGIAREISGKILRPGFEYILLYKETLNSPSNFTSHIEIECNGILATLISVPENISADDLKLYKDLGLTVCKTIRVWPAGLLARSWDGEGTSEWLTTETPCFGIANDHPVDEYSISLGNLSLNIKAKQSGIPTFIKLPSLPVGRYPLIVRSKGATALSNPTPVVEGMVLLEVREPVSWSPRAMLHDGLRAFIEPGDDNLDVFLNGKSELKVYGPKDRSIAVRFDFYSLNNLLGSVEGPENMDLPVDSEKVRKSALAAIKKDDFQLSRRMDIIISGDDLGQSIISLHRQLTPIRWLYKWENNTAFLRLVDETDTSDPLEVSFFSFQEPALEEKLSPEDWLQKKEINNMKGLVLARKSDHEHSIAIMPFKQANDFHDLGIIPKITGLPDDPQKAALEVLNLLRKWDSARHMDIFAETNCLSVIQTLALSLFSSFCGSDWPDKERSFLAGNSENALAEFSKRVGNVSFSNIIRHRIQTLDLVATSSEDHAEWFVERAHRCDVCKNASLSRFSLVLASDPLGFNSYSDDDFYKNFHEMMNHKILMRCARLFSLGLSKSVNPYKPDALIKPAGWRWS